MCEKHGTLSGSISRREIAVPSRSRAVVEEFATQYLRPTIAAVSGDDGNEAAIAGDSTATQRAVLEVIEGGKSSSAPSSGGSSSETSSDAHFATSNSGPKTQPVGRLGGVKEMPVYGATQKIPPDEYYSQEAARKRLEERNAAAQSQPEAQKAQEDEDRKVAERLQRLQEKIDKIKEKAKAAVPETKTVHQKPAPKPASATATQPVQKTIPPAAQNAKLVSTPQPPQPAQPKSASRPAQGPSSPTSRETGDRKTRLLNMIRSSRGINSSMKMFINEGRAREYYEWRENFVKELATELGITTTVDWRHYRDREATDYKAQIHKEIKTRLVQAVGERDARLVPAWLS